VTNVNTVREARKLLETIIGSIDILINDAGTGGKLPQDFFACDLENLRAIFKTNFFDVLLITQEFLPLLKKSGQASIIKVSKISKAYHQNWLKIVVRLDGNQVRFFYHNLIQK